MRHNIHLPGRSLYYIWKAFYLDVYIKVLYVPVKIIDNSRGNIRNVVYTLCHREKKHS